jgi:hypothetical protein
VATEGGVDVAARLQSAGFGDVVGMLAAAGRNRRDQTPPAHEQRQVDRCDRLRRRKVAAQAAADTMPGTRTNSQ